jgi:orotate phosphoribosyltransferase
MDAVRERVLSQIIEHGVKRREEPFLLASGARSSSYVDVKRAICEGSVLADVAELIATDAISAAVSIRSGTRWFSVRKQPKGRGHERWIEGSRLNSTSRVLLVEDVISTGASTLAALDRVKATVASVVGVVPLGDRGDAAGKLFSDLGVPYAAVFTYRKIGIAAV